LQPIIFSLKAREVFDAFYKTNPLSQESLQEFQFHILSLTPAQLQRFDLTDSFSALDETMNILEKEKNPPYPNLLQISYYMWPLMNASNPSGSNDLAVAPPKLWRKRELSQMGKLLFLLPKSTLFQIPPELIHWDSATIRAIRSPHLSRFQIWHLTSQILTSVDERFKSDYVFMMPAPFQKGIPAHNMSQILSVPRAVRPEIIRALSEAVDGMLPSQQVCLVLQN